MANRCEPLPSPDYYANYEVMWKELRLAAPALRG
jgi:hypothetical protein